MSLKSAIEHRFAGRKGMRITSFGPLGCLSLEEWNKWLNYIPKFQQERMEYLSSKLAKELTHSEVNELRRFQKELKMQSISQIYGKEEMNKDDAIEFMNYTSQEQLNSLIKRKLTDKEYQLAIKKANQLVSDLSDEELLAYCEEQEKEFTNLSMVDSFVLRRVSRVANAIANKKTGETIAYNFKQNELMRKRSYYNVSKRFGL